MCVKIRLFFSMFFSNWMSRFPDKRKGCGDNEHFYVWLNKSTECGRSMENLPRLRAGAGANQQNNGLLCVSLAAATTFPPSFGLALYFFLFYPPSTIFHFLLQCLHFLFMYSPSLYALRSLVLPSFSFFLFFLSLPDCLSLHLFIDFLD